MTLRDGYRLTRREFVRDGSLALVLGGPLFAALDRRALVTDALPPFTLETPAQYKAKAVQLDAAVQMLGSLVSLRPATTAEIERLNAGVAAAASKLDLHHAWMVSIALADAGLAARVRAAIRDSATFQTFVKDAKLDAAVIDQVADKTRSIRNTIDALNKKIRAIAEQVQQLEEAIAKLEQFNEAVRTTFPKIKDQLARDRECQQRWALGAAVLVTVSSTNPALGPAVNAAAADLAAVYRNTGEDLVQKERQLAGQRYQQCLTAAAALPPAQRAKAVAACQAQWLRDQGALFT
jgi:hypothetical protein